MASETKTAHTPGPWQAIASQPVDGWDGFTVCAQPNAALRGFTKVIAEVAGERFESKDIGEANARLIAAAPDMLAALKALHADCEEYSRINNLHNEDGSPATNHAMRMAANAIAKAEAAS